MSNRASRDCSPPPEIRAIMLSIFRLEGMEEMELFHQLKSVSRLLSYLVDGYHMDDRLSAARMRLLVRLAVAHEMDHPDGIMPSDLSRFLGVSRNTISALLNGLEEQGLIERHLHPSDRRQFLIQITPEGLEMAHRRAPLFAEFVSDLFKDFSAEERENLKALLGKLHVLLSERAGARGHGPVTDGELS
jgi:DNA-binding MarR family transcriptional regulator